MSIESIDITNITKIINFNSYQDYQTYLQENEPNQVTNTLSLVSGSADSYVDLYYGSAKVSDVWVVDTLDISYPDDKLFIVPVTNQGQVVSYDIYYKKGSQFIKINVSGVDISSKLDKLTTTGLYAYTHNGTSQEQIQISQSATGDSLVRRTSNGQIIAQSPSSSNHVVTRSYADDTYVSRLDSNQSYSSGAYVYGFQNGSPKPVFGIRSAGTSDAADTLAQKTNTGTLKAVDPSGNDNQELVTVGYLKSNVPLWSVL